MGKRHLSILLAVAVFGGAFLAACAGNGTEQDNTQATKADSNIQVDLSITDYKTEAKEDTSFCLGKDDQPFFVSKMGMSISNGSGDYRFLNGALYFYDYSTGITVPLCNKPECDHNTNTDDSTCNAYFPDDKYFFDKGYSYYDNSLYLMGQGSDSKYAVSLYKISLDGAVREEVCKLFDISDFNSIGVFTVHRGFAFWSLNTEDGAQLFRMKLSDKKIQRVFALEKNAGYIMRFIGAGDYLYFSYSFAVDEDMENWSGYICRLNIYSGKATELVETHNCYAVLDNKIFYFKHGKIMSVNVDGSGESEFADIPDNSTLMVSDSKNLYVTNWDNGVTSQENYRIFVISSEGTEIGTIPISECGFFCGVSLENIYIETTKRTIEFFDKSQIGSKQCKSKLLLTVTDTGGVVLN